MSPEYYFDLYGNPVPPPIGKTQPHVSVDYNPDTKISTIVAYTVDEEGHIFLDDVTYA